MTEITIPVANGVVTWPVHVTERQAEEIFALYPALFRINCATCYYIRERKRRRL
jgi:hypothetical protein